MARQTKWTVFCAAGTLLILFNSLLISFNLGVAAAAAVDDDEPAPVSIRTLCDSTIRNYRLLTPPEDEQVPESATDKNCICLMVHQAPWGEPKLQIDCTALELKSEKLYAQNLPFGTQLLDLAWNRLEKMPKFNKNLEQVQIYRLHNNHIETLAEQDLNGFTYLDELDLSNNAIESIELGAFKDQRALKRLNLGYNNIRTLHENIFRPLRALVHLTLSGNDLNALMLEKNLFFNLQLNADSVQVLELEYCHLTWLSVESAVALKEIRLRGNGFFKQLPLLSPNIKLLDLSANPVRRLDTTYDGQLNALEILLLEDMPNLYLLDVSSLATFHSLKKLSLQGSRNFSYVHELAFDGIESPKRQEMDMSAVFEQLNEIILTGTNVRKLSEFLHEYIPKVEVIALDGCPMVCDCDLKWLQGKRRGIVTNGICEKPAAMKDRRIDEVEPEEMKNCSDFSRYMFKIMNGLLIIFMIVLCCVAMYFLVMGCRPSKKFYVRQRMGMNSPYSRITVEPIGTNFRPNTIA